MSKKFSTEEECSLCRVLTDLICSHMKAATGWKATQDILAILRQIGLPSLLPTLG